MSCSRQEKKGAPGASSVSGLVGEAMGLKPQVLTVHSLLPVARGSSHLSCISAGTFYNEANDTFKVCSN